MNRRGRIHRSLWLAAFVMLLLVAAAWPGYDWWRDRRAAQYKADCQAAAKASDWPRLARIAEVWSRFDCESGDAWLYRAQAAEETNDIALAAAAIDHVPDDDPRAVIALLQRVEMLFRDLNDPKSAEATCRRILKISPRIDTAWQRIIFLDAMTARRELLIRDIRDAIRLGSEPPEAYVYLLCADWIHFSNGYSANSHWLEKYPGDETYEVARAYHLVKAETAANSGATAMVSSTSLMNACIEKHPRNLEVLSYRVESAIENDDQEEVTNLLKDLSPAAKKDSRFWRYLGWLNGVNDRAKESEEAYREALRLNPYDWHARHELSIVLRRSGDADAASHYAEVAADCKKLSVDLAQLPNAADVGPDLLDRIRKLALAVDDELVSESLKTRRLKRGQVVRFDI